jgi:hypothetical protein
MNITVREAILKMGRGTVLTWPGADALCVVADAIAATIAQPHYRLRFVAMAVVELIDHRNLGALSEREQEFLGLAEDLEHERPTPRGATHVWPDLGPE